ALARPVGAQAAPGGEERGEDMNHLTDDQLSARLDDALSTVERASFDAHLATCAECRERLASIGTLDRSLAAALQHDPGEESFATSAGRVAERIATAEAPAVPTPGRRSPWAWMLSPRALSFAGGTAALVLVAGIAWMQFRHQDAGTALRAAEPHGIVGSEVR